MPGLRQEEVVAELEPGTKARIARVLGVVMVKGGNHKEEALRGRPYYPILVEWTGWDGVGPDNKILRSL